MRLCIYKTATWRFRFRLSLFIVVQLFTSLCLGFSALTASAQQLRMTSPTSAVRVAEAEDFSSSVLGNSWDFSERRDIGFEIGFAGDSVTSSGVWRARLASTGAYVFPLFGGYSGSLFAEGVAGDKSLPRFGAKHPISAAKYYFLSMRSAHSARSTRALYWNTNPSPSLFPDGSNRAASYDGYYWAGAQPNSGFTIYSQDMRGGSFEQQAGAWAASIFAFRFDPSIAGTAGSVFELDWMRLVDPSSAPTIEVRWDSLQIPNDTLITVWLDTNAGGYDGTAFARYHHASGVPSQSSPWYVSNPNLKANTGVHRFPSAMLPAGAYHFYVTAERMSGGVRTLIAQSAYSAELRVSARPSGYFTAPSERSGVDYAASELGDAWDMSSMSDVQNGAPGTVAQQQRQFSNASASSGVFQATADVPLAGNNETDAQMHLRVPANRPITASRYRYLTYRLGADESLYPSIEDKVARGWVSRPIYWDGDLFQRGGSLKAHVLYEGMKTYTVDLWDTANVEAGLSWTGLGRLSNLRIDPLETTLPTWFFLDWVELRGENTPVGDRYTLQWVLEDSDSQSLNVDVFLDTNQGGNDGALVYSQRGVAPGTHQFVLNTAGLAAGTYYPYVQIYDGDSQRSVYANVPLVIGSAADSSGRAARRYDYDGDNLSDPTVYRPGGLATFFVQASSAAAIVRQWGLAGYWPVEGDFDGDKRSDLAVVADINGYLHWYIIRSSDGGLYYRVWGLRGDSLAVADYDGDGTAEIGVYRQGLWFVLDESGTTAVHAWGEKGDIPVPADYDGDSVADIAIWRPRDGTWWIISSGFARGLNSSPYLVKQWGLPGDVPLIQDYDADGKTDFVVWRPWNGTWYLRLSASDSAEIYQWGLPGDVPVAAHFLNDNASFSVYRPSTGQWFHRNRQGLLLGQQWGLPGDIVPQKTAR